MISNDKNEFTYNSLANNSDIKFPIHKNENFIIINISTNIFNKLEFYLINPKNKKSIVFSENKRKIKTLVGKDKLKVSFEYLDKDLYLKKITIKIISKSYITFGLWTLKFINNNCNSRFIKSNNNLIRNDNEIPPGFISAVNVIYGPGFEEDINNLGDDFYFYNISEGFGLVFIREDKFDNLFEIFNISSVYKTQPYIRLSKLSEISRGISNGVVATEDIGANFFKNNPNVSISGKGVLIGIADSGIDYLHKDFIYPDGTSKILYLWDQTKEGNPPDGFFIGTEYTREDINKAILENDSTLSIDEEGNGTLLSGICAGLGNINPEYKGVAEDADLIIVKLKKINNEYNNATLFAAGEYMYKKALNENMPLVINISLGNSLLAGITSRFITNNLFLENGFCQVVGAGNEGNTQIHTTGKVEFVGDIKEVELEVAQDEDEINIELWVNRPDKIDVIVISPSGEESKLAFVSNYNVISGLFDLENTNYRIFYVYPFTYSGQQRTLINLSNVKEGIWKIRLIGSYITNGIYQMYLENRQFLNPGTKFSESDPSYTINYPGTYEDVITVGAYDTINNSIWPQSSRGPTIESTFKPDILAPGVNIIGPYINNDYAKISGTAVSAAYTSGAVALFLQYILVDERYENKAFIQKIKTYLRAGAKREQDILYPNYSYGYGSLNIRGMFDQLK